MPGEITTLLLGAQGGEENSFVRLYQTTNAVVLRYLRVISDADPAPLALATWSTLLQRMPSCVVDDDDDWLELAVATARENALEATGAEPAPPALAIAGAAPDALDEGIAALRACPPAVADVLAMGVVAGLGRDSIATLTGQDPNTVHHLVRDGQATLTVPLETLVVTMRVPARRAEVRDLPTVMALFAEQSHAVLPPVAAGVMSVAAEEASFVEASAAAVGEPSVIDLLSWEAPTAATAGVVLERTAATGDSPRWVRVSAGAAAWALAVGGIGTAAAMSGVLPAAIHNLLGNQGPGPVVTAQGPLRTGGVPSITGGGGSGTRPPGAQLIPEGPQTPATQPNVTSGGGGATAVSLSGNGSGGLSGGGSGGSTGIVVVPAVFTSPSSSTPPTSPTTPSSPTVTPTPTPPSVPPSVPPTTTPQPPSSGGGTVIAAGKGQPRHSAAVANRQARAAARAAAKAAQAAERAARAAARAEAKARAAAARAAAKATKAEAKAQAAATAAAKVAMKTAMKTGTKTGTKTGAHRA